jgi:pimeloyl-ACP methyl ester carboxylesterase
MVGLWVSLSIVSLASESGAPGRAPDPCPSGLPDKTRCYSGRDQNGAYYLIAVPDAWNGALVLYNHGGPNLGSPGPVGAAGLGPRFQVILGQGFALGASSYRRGGWAVSEAAEDTENVRRIFIQRAGVPSRTLAYGTSYGGIVTSILAERYGSHFDAAMPLCNLGAGTRRHAYLYIDLRTVYQYYCHNHPRADETQYDLYLGLAPGESMTQADLTRRLNECTGVGLPPEQRTDEQRRNLANILGVTRIPEGGLSAQLSDATFHLREISQVELGGVNALPNADVVYSGSDADEALNLSVQRYQSAEEAVASLSADADPTGVVSIPIMGMHAINDAVLFVEQESAYRDAFEQAETLDYLFQTYTTGGGHCGFTTSEFETVFHATLDWVETGIRPTQEGIVASCAVLQRTYGDACRFDPNYVPAPYESRVPARQP